MKRLGLKPQDGFTLIEVLAAAIILALAFTTLAAIFIRGQNEASAQVQQNQLIDLADQQVEQIRSAVNQQGFSSLAMSTTKAPPVLSTYVVRSTFLDPDEFVETTGTTPCFEIADNYDNVATAGSAPYGTAPGGFTTWSNCNSHAEPLSLLSGGLINLASTASPCATGSSSQPLTFPCTVALPSTNCTLSSGLAVTAVPRCAATVYAFVTYTYVGCSPPSNATAGTGFACPTVSSGQVQVPTSGTGLPTSTASSTVYGDARRVTVVIVPNIQTGTGSTGSQGRRVTPVYLSTVFTNPAPSTTGAGSLGLQLTVNP